MTVAGFMELALYDPQHGYYARAAQRSGRAGDFFTSVDVGALFGELLEVQLFEMATLVNNAKAAESATTAEDDFSPKDCPQVLDGFDLVEAGAGNGRFAADMLHAAKQRECLDGVLRVIVVPWDIVEIQKSKHLIAILLQAIHKLACRLTGIIVDETFIESINRIPKLAQEAFLEAASVHRFNYRLHQAGEIRSEFALMRAT